MLRHDRIQSYSINSPQESDGLQWNFELLSNAIVYQATQDYKWLWANLKAGDSTKSEIENFFRSDWFKALTDVQGDKLMYAVKMQGLTESLLIRIDNYLEELAKKLRAGGKHMSKKARSQAYLNIAGLLKTKSKAPLNTTKEFSDGFQAGIETAFDVIYTLLRENENGQPINKTV